MNIQQEISAVGTYRMHFDFGHCALFHNTPTSVYYFVTHVHAAKINKPTYGGVNVIACFHNISRVHVFSDTDINHYVYFTIFNKKL